MSGRPSPRAKTGTKPVKGGRPLARLERIGLTLLVVSPAAFLPGALNRFALPSAAAAGLGAGLILLGRQDRRIPRWLLLLLGHGAAVLLLASAVSASPSAALLGRAPRFEGIFMLVVYAAALLAGSALALSVRTAGMRQILLTAWSLTSLVVAAVAVVQGVGADVLLTNVSREGSLLGNATSLGAFGVLTLSVLAAPAFLERRPIVIAGAGAGATCIALSGSRSALLGVIVASTVLVLVHRGSIRKMLLAVALAVPAVLLVIPQARDRILGGGTWSGSTLHGRWLLWEQATSVFRDAPLLGVGPSGFQDAAVPHRSVEWYRDIGPANPADSPHNVVLQVLDAGGIAALVLIVATCWLLARRVIRTLGPSTSHSGPGLDAELLAAVAGYGVIMLANFTEPTTTPLALFALGLLIRWQPSDPEPPQWAHRAVGAVSLACAAVLALGALAEIPLRSAYTDVLAGRLDRAEERFRSAQSLRPWDQDLAVGALHAYAAAAEQGYSDGTQLLDLAAGWEKDASQALPDDPRVLADRAGLAEYAEDWAGAAELYARALARDPHNPQLLLRSGIALANTDDVTGAEEAWMESARIAVDSPEPWDNLARLYDLQERSEDAQRARDQAARRR